MAQVEPIQSEIKTKDPVAPEPAAEYDNSPVTGGPSPRSATPGSSPDLAKPATLNQELVLQVFFHHVPLRELAACLEVAASAHLKFLAVA